MKQSGTLYSDNDIDDPCLLTITEVNQVIESRKQKGPEIGIINDMDFDLYIDVKLFALQKRIDYIFK